jgi:cytoskeletal protein RodZ
MRLIHSGRKFWAVLGVAALLWVVVGCGSNSSSPAAGSTTTASASVSASAGCADAVALKSSLDALKTVDVKQDGVAALTSAVADVKTKLDAATASASSVLQPEVEQVRTAVTALEAATNGLTTSNLTQKAPAIASALRQVAAAALALSTTLSQSCPGS